MAETFPPGGVEVRGPGPRGPTSEAAEDVRVGPVRVVPGPWPATRKLPAHAPPVPLRVTHTPVPSGDLGLGLQAGPGAALAE